MSDNDKIKLETTRKVINDIDSEISELLSKRFIMAEEALDAKKELGMGIYDASREDELLAKLSNQLADNDIKKHILNIYKNILAESKLFQHERSCTGPRVMIINGPNLNKLGTREPEIYGYETYDNLKNYITEKAESLCLKIDIYQSNLEGEIITKIQEAAEYDGLIINPAGYSHTSVAILDALLSIQIPVIEVHLSNIHKRDEFRDRSLSARRAEAVLCGMGFDSYALALEYMAKKLRANL